MNWLSKIAMKFQKGQLAIYSDFGWKSVDVVEIMDEVVDKEYGGLFTGVKCKVVESFRVTGFGSRKPGEISTPNIENIYSSISDIIEKDSSYIYPDVILSALNNTVVLAVSKKYPQLGIIRPVNVTYEIYWIHSYPVLVCLDTNTPIWNDNKWYWAIPDLKLRSRDMGLKIGNKPIDVLYKTKEDAANSAERYLNHIFYDSQEGK